MTDSTNWGYFTDGTIHLICSSHNDIAWFDTPAATITWRDEKSITPALARMAQHEDVRFSMENVLYLLEYLERHPERKAEIHQLALDRRFDWGATYNQPYESLLSGEQLVRQTYFGRRLVKKLLPGADARVYYSPDVPGRAMQMPQILAKSGVPYMLISRHKPSLQYWYSPDGSRVLSWSMGQYGQIYNFGHAFKGTPQETVDFIRDDLRGWVDEYTARRIPAHFAYLWSHDYSPPADFDALIAAWREMRRSEPAPGDPVFDAGAVPRRRQRRAARAGRNLRRAPQCLALHSRSDPSPRHQRQARRRDSAARRRDVLDHRSAARRELRQLPGASVQPRLGELDLRRSRLGRQQRAHHRRRVPAQAGARPRFERRPADARDHRYRPPRATGARHADHRLQCAVVAAVRSGARAHPVAGSAVQNCRRAGRGRALPARLPDDWHRRGSHVRRD